MSRPSRPAITCSSNAESATIQDMGPRLAELFATARAAAPEYRGTRRHQYGDG